ncbi:MAG: IspD/TarI family cytidylyltransferase [Candidatus Hydrogenedentota bacterium]
MRPSRPDPMTTARASWILLAAGSSTRFGRTGENPARSKLLESLGADRVIDVTLRALKNALPGARIILVSTPELRDEIGMECAWVNGGQRRQDSARHGILAARETDIALIHDAARPFVTREIVDRLREALRENDAAAPGIPVTDTIRRSNSGEFETLDRSTLLAMQTPQAVWMDVAAPAFEASTGPEEFTDDLAVIAAFGGRIAVTRGDKSNMKITTREDLLHAERILENLNPKS